MMKNSDNKQKKMNEDIIDDEALSDSLSNMSSRRGSVLSAHPLNPHSASRRSSATQRRSSAIDPHENNPIKQEIPVKVLVVNGKCSDIFKSTLENCVEDCILEFPGGNSVYVSKPGHSIPITTGSKQLPVHHSREHTFSLHPSAKPHQRKNSARPYSGMRAGQTSHLTLATAAMSAATVARQRHQFAQPRFSLVNNISEETADVKTAIESNQDPVATDPDSTPTPLLREETASHYSNFDVFSRSSSPACRKLQSTPAHRSYRDRQRKYLLSDLVMLGPEHFVHDFNLPRPSRYRLQSPSKQPCSASQLQTKITEKYDELEQTKQDLFHRYLWTQKPQVACRIRPMSTYVRSRTSII